jgi:hypothetical protein
MKEKIKIKVHYAVYSGYGLSTAVMYSNQLPFGNKGFSLPQILYIPLLRDGIFTEPAASDITNEIKENLLKHDPDNVNIEFEFIESTIDFKPTGEIK